MRTRLATLADLPAIMRVERESFGEVGEETMARDSVMADRILLCNVEHSGWFWVAETARGVCGYLVTQPIASHPDECVSWEASTNDGRLRGTFDENGDSILGVSLGTGKNAPPKAFYFLVLCGMVKLAETGKKRLMLCSRLPGLASTEKEKDISPERYWKLSNKFGVPRDPLLRMWYQVFGVGPYKFMPNGFLPDKESGGHGALVVVTDPRKSMELLSKHIPVPQSLMANLERKLAMKVISIKPDDERLQYLYGTRKPWWDIHEGRMVDSQTLYLPFGCPDWGEKGGARNGLCQFCGLPGAVQAFREGFYEGLPVPQEDHLAFIERTLESSMKNGELHTLLIFNAGSFTAMPGSLQVEVAKLVASYSSIKRLVIESRAPLVQEGIIAPIAETLAAVGKKLTIRVGVETKDSDLRLKVLKKGHSDAQLKRAADLMRSLGVTSGGYALLNPAPGLDPGHAVRECVETIKWILEEDGLGMDEVYLGPTCVSPNTPLAKAWEEEKFSPPSLSSVREVFEQTLPKYPRRIHLLAFKDEPPFLAVPSNSNPRGIPESLEGASDEDRLYHARFDLYRETMNPLVIL